MNVKYIMPFLIPIRGKISILISDILILEQKLNNIDKQSKYFQWAKDSHHKRHAQLLDEYDCIRQEFNKMSQEDLTKNLADTKRVMRRKADLNPKTYEYFRIKKFTDELPIFKILREDAEILRDILPENRRPYFLDD